MIIPYQGKTPKLAEDVFVAETAVIIGDVTIGRGGSVWYGAVLRGDLAPIVIGEYVNIQDNCTVHVDDGVPVNIADNVIVGHNAVVHSAVIERCCLIGMGATLLSGCVIGHGCTVAAGALVKENAHIEPLKLAAGVPAKVIRELDPACERRHIEESHMYMRLAAAYTPQK